MQDEDFASAVAAGILEPHQAEALRVHLRQRQRAALPAAAPGDDEHFRLLSGFNDVFVVVAMLVLLGALAFVLAQLADALTGPGLFVSAWLLAEYFVRRRRLALPGVALALVGALGLGIAGYDIARHLGAAANQPDVWMGAGLGASLAALLQHWRFRTPIHVAIGVGSLGLAALQGLRIALGSDLPLGLHVGMGLFVLLLAIGFDATDRERRGLRADAAFWLHLLAAPWLVHALFLMLAQQGAGSLQTVAALGLYLLLGLVSLLLDRRALLLAGLSYVLIAVSDLFMSSGRTEKAMAVAVAALVIGASLLLLAAFWQAARRPLLRLLPPALQRWLPVAPTAQAGPLGAR